MELEEDLQNLEKQLEKKEEEKLSVTGDLAIAEENLDGLRVKAAVPVSPGDQDKNANNGVQEDKVAENKKSRDGTREARPVCGPLCLDVGAGKAAAVARCQQKPKAVERDVIGSHHRVAPELLL
jgi:hypothetical protein